MIFLGNNLQVNVRMIKLLPHSLDESVDEVIIFFPTNTAMSQAEIQVIVQEILVLEHVSHQLRVS